MKFIGMGEFALLRLMSLCLPRKVILSVHLFFAFLHVTSWFIDYWVSHSILHGLTIASSTCFSTDPFALHYILQMEQGLMRNVLNHQLSVPWRWRKGTYKVPRKFRKRQQPKYYDPHCTNGDISAGCEPVEILSADKLFDATTGPLETARIANVLMRDARTGQYVIDSETWNCIWEEMIVNRKGLPVTADRPNYGLYDYNFSSEILTSMVAELNRLISKYGSPQYSSKATANRIVELLTEHRAALYVELAELASGARVLTERDFLGPETRKRLEQGLPLLDEGSTYTPEQLDALVDHDSEETDDTSPEDLEVIDQDSELSSPRILRPLIRTRN